MGNKKLSAKKSPSAKTPPVAESLARIEKHLARHLGGVVAASFDGGQCWRWESTPFGGKLLPFAPPADARLKTLVGLDEQIAEVEQNTAMFLQDKPANNVLLTGPPGCGKSSVVRGVFAKYAGRGLPSNLRLVEMDSGGLQTLAELLAALSGRREKFILYCDDLSFGENSALFARLKSAMEGAVSAQNNVLFYATSNRRNLVAESFADNMPAADDDMQPEETRNEKHALASRFGLWVPFYAPDADEYKTLAAHWLQQLGKKPTKKLLQEAIYFADIRGARNGRIAKQFAINIAGRKRAN